MVETSKGSVQKRKNRLKDEFGTLDANKALEIYERLSKTCISQPKENKSQTEKSESTRYLTVKNQNLTQK